MLPISASNIQEISLPYGACIGESAACTGAPLWGETDTLTCFFFLINFGYEQNLSKIILPS